MSSCGWVAGANEALYVNERRAGGSEGGREGVRVGG